MWQAYIYTGDGSGAEETYQVVGVHECDDADYAKFYKPSESASSRIASLKFDRALMCLNKKDNNGVDANPNLYGSDENYPHRRIELMYRPCVPVTMDSDNMHLHEDACLVSGQSEPELAKQLADTKKWISQPDLNIVYNHETVQMDKYGADSIKTEARVMNYQWSEKEPSFLMAKLQTDTLEDSASWFNLGQYQERSFTQLSLGRMYSSAWNSYPAKYKFFGLQINASDKKTVYKRVKYDLLQLFSYIGGLSLVLFLMA